MKENLLTETLKLVELAKSKGFDSEADIKPTFFEHWMNAEDVFCNTACAIICMWLRQKHRINLWVEPVLDNKYRWGLNYYSITNYNSVLKANTNYEYELLDGIKEALNSLPPAAQE